MEAYVKSQINNEVGEITFFHPQSNSLPGDILRQLAAEITAMGKNDDVKVMVLRSEGEKAFCAGASFDELISIKTLEEGTKFFSGFSLVINAIRKTPKFVIARVHGKAVGGGVGLAAAADYTLATKESAVRLSELALGIGPFVVGPAVERKIGTAAFSYLTINPAEWKSAEWARDKNLYADVLPSVSDLDKAIQTLTCKLATCSPEAMAQLKRVMWEGTDNWDTLLIERAAMSGKLVLSDFTKIYIESFKAKTK